MDEQKATRARKLGALIRDARKHSSRSIEECAEVLDMPFETFGQVEVGEYVVSLPELEVLAVYLDVPMGYFWGTHTLEEGGQPRFQEMLSLRHKIVGGLLRQARLDAERTIEEVAGELGEDPATIEAYETGREKMPFLQLEQLAGILDLPITHFLDDKHGPLGRHEARQKMERRFREMSPEMKEFVTKPANIAYLQTAKRLSEMDVEQLRAIAAGILEITY